MNFAATYRSAFESLMISPDLNITCRGLSISRETTAATFSIRMQGYPMASIFSHPTHRVMPIRFALAELCYILAGRGDVESIASYNKSMVNYSNDGKTISGSYGLRLDGQLERLIERLEKDQYTRQACASIFSKEDCLTHVAHIPCNVFLQFLSRDRVLNLHVASRSSDFVTGFSIDSFHWQALLVMMANELNLIADTLYYNIGSLHIYSDDLSVVEQWKITYPYKDYYIEFPLKLSNAISRCKKHFDGGMSSSDLAQLLGVDGSSLDIVCELDEMFQKYRNKLTR